MKNCFSDTQASVLNQLLVEQGIEIDPLHMTYIMAVVTERCLYADEQIHDLDRQDVYSCSLTVIAGSTMFDDPKYRHFDDLLDALTETVAKSFSLENEGTVDRSVTGVISSIMKSIRDSDAYGRNAEKFEKDDDKNDWNLAKVLVIGTALFSSSLLINRDISEQGLREELRIVDSQALEESMKDINEVFVERKEITPEDAPRAEE